MYILYHTLQPPSSLNTSASGIDVNALSADLSQKIDAIPKICAVRSYFDDVVLPCIPAIAANISNRPATKSETDACCAGMKMNSKGGDLLTSGA